MGDNRGNVSINESSVFNMSVYDQKYWIECEVILAVLTVMAVYIFICISVYASKKRAKPTRDTGGGKQGKRLYLMLVLSSGFAVLRMVSDHIVAFTSSYSDEMCFGTIAVSTVLYAFGLFSVYLFLWMRQNIFYANPVLAKVLNRAVTLASWCCLVLMVVSAICLTVLYNVPNVNGWDYQVTGDGCKGVLIANGEVVSGLVTATLTTFQVLLLILFVYPLLSRKTQRYRSAGNKGSSNNGAGHVSVSNTDDNITDGENSSAQHDAKCKIVKSRQSSENESGVDVSSSGDSPKIRSKCVEESSRNESIVTPSKHAEIEYENQKYNSKIDSPRKSNLLSKFQHPGKIFYRRNPNIVDEKLQDQINSNNSALSTGAQSQKDHHQSTSSSGNREKKSKHKRSKTQQGRRMMAFLRKAFILMMICIITDIVSAVIQSQINLPEIVYLVIYDMNLMLNIICIVMSFRDWDVILFPMCARCKISKLKGADYDGSSGADSRKAEHYRRNSSGLSAHAVAAHPSQETPFHRDLRLSDHRGKQLDLNGKT